MEYGSFICTIIFYLLLYIRLRTELVMLRLRWELLTFTRDFFSYRSFQVQLLFRLKTGDIQKARSLKIPEFWSPPPPCSLSFVSDHHHLPPSPPSFKLRSFWLELTFSPSIFMLVKFKEKKLMMTTSIFGWTQRIF